MISGAEARKRRLRQAALAAAGPLLLAGCEDSRGDGTARLTRDPDEYTPPAGDSGSPPNDFLHAGLDSFYPRCAPGDLAGASQDP
ncbi:MULTISPECIES: hypothetical protein [unclassified Streptomyces]|uniref:hypothetical protein n=1 Tax=unclassified Streptomyces TaxID=2593676 RepID=UPI00380F7B2F